MSNQKQIVKILNHTTLQREGTAFVERIANYLASQHLRLERYGSWNMQVDENDCAYGVCSECGHETWESKLPNYCSHCGAKMDGGK